MGQKKSFVEHHRYANGNVYTGEMVGSRRHGKGTYTWADDGCFYEGDWVKNEQTGRGKMTFKNGNIFEGSFYKNNIHGQGSLKTANGEQIRGRFEFIRRFITNQGSKYPVGEYSLEVEVRANDGRVLKYTGPATLHLFTGLLVMPNIKDPNVNTSFYESAVVVTDAVEILDPDTKDKTADIAVVEATAVEATNSNQPTSVLYGQEDSSKDREVKRKEGPVRLGLRNFF